MDGDYDLVLRGGLVADGGGGALYEADVAVRDGVIAAIGHVAGRGREEIVAKDLLVTPGFVDIHTHYDGQATWDSHLTPSVWHGVTTAVMGNCGVGFAPVRPADRDRLIELMEGVEDIPGAALHEGLAWDWESFPEYLDALDRHRHGIDICAQLPHGALRVYVMGERGARLEPATAADIAAMRTIACDAMRAGALGFSTSRTINHKTVKGDPTPSLKASEDELMGIALGLADAGSGVLEWVSDFRPAERAAELAMIERIVSRSGRGFSVSILQTDADPDGWRVLLDWLSAASGRGLPVRGQVAPRFVGTMLGLTGSVTPFSPYPAFREIAARPLDEKLAILRDPDFRRRLLAEATAAPAAGGGFVFGYDRMYPLGVKPDYEPRPEMSIAAMAAREGRHPAEITYDLMLEDEGRNFVVWPAMNFAGFNLEPCREMMAHDRTVIGLGDGGAHVGVISDASFPTTLLSYWGRDRAEGRFDLGWLVKRQTADTAAAVGLLDRGRIAPGMKADLNVIDIDRLAVERPAIAYDLPAGGRRLLQRATGYVATIVAGVPVYRDGEPTGALPGRLVRGPQARPAAG